METQKIVNLLNATDNEFSKFAKKSGMLLMTRIIQKIVKEMKMIQALNLKQKSSTQMFAIVQMHIFL